MDKIEHRLTEGDAWYGHIQVICMKGCPNHPILFQMEGGNNDNIAVTADQVRLAYGAVWDHKHEPSCQDHNPVIYEWRKKKGSETSQVTKFVKFCK